MFAAHAGGNCCSTQQQPAVLWVQQQGTVAHKVPVFADLFFVEVDFPLVVPCCAHHIETLDSLPVLLLLLLWQAKTVSTATSKCLGLLSPRLNPSKLCAW